MHAGYAQTDMTPEPGEELTGYGYYLNRRAVGTLDPLRARALAMEEAGERAVIVQLDLLGLAREYVAAVRAAVRKATGLPPHHLMLHCTHTHSGPGSLHLEGCGLPSEHFLGWLAKRIVQVVSDALNDLKPLNVAQRFDTDWPAGFAYNRVGAGDLDTRVRGLRLVPEGAAPIVVLSYACHPVTLGRNREYSADYCGTVLQELGAYGIRGLYLNGCCGDIDPLSNSCRWGGGTRETLLIYGRDLASVARQGMADAVTWHTGPLQADSRLVPLEVQPTSEEELRRSLETLQQRLETEPDNGPLRVDVRWHKRMIRAHQRGILQDIAAAEIQVIGCGDVAFVGMSAEAFTVLGAGVRAGAPGHQLMIAATSNGVVGYLGTAADARRQGYASHAASKIYGMPLLQPDAGERWAAAGAELVRGVTGD